MFFLREKKEKIKLNVKDCMAIKFTLVDIQNCRALDIRYTWKLNIFNGYTAHLMTWYIYIYIYLKCIKNLSFEILN